jgi:hypothetical protein
LHTTTTVSDYDTISVVYKPNGNIAAGSSNREIVLRLSVSGAYYDYDGGIRSIYTADGITISSGARYSEVVSNTNNG